MDMHTELVARNLTTQRDYDLARERELRRRAMERTPAVRRLTLAERTVALFLLVHVHVPRALARRATESRPRSLHRLSHP
jgi:hypothetical protein